MVTALLPSMVHGGLSGVTLATSMVDIWQENINLMLMG